MSEAGQYIELGPGQDRPSFDARPAPQLPADHLRRHVDTLCRRSTPAALPRVFVDSTRSPAAGMMPVHARLAAGRLCDRAMASRQATPMAEHCGAVHPWGGGRPSIRPSRALDGRAPRRLRATRPFVACHDTRGRRPSRWQQSRGRRSRKYAKLGRAKALTGVSSTLAALRGAVLAKRRFDLADAVETVHSRMARHLTDI